MNITQKTSSISGISISDIARDEENFQVIANSLKDAVIIVDDKGKISCWNSAAEKMFGYNSTEALGKNVHQLIVPKTMGPEAKDRIKTSMEIFEDTGMGYYTVGNVSWRGAEKTDPKSQLSSRFRP